MAEEYKSAEQVLEEWSQEAQSKSPSTTIGQLEGDKRQKKSMLDFIFGKEKGIINKALEKAIKQK